MTHSRTPASCLLPQDHFALRPPALLLGLIFLLVPLLSLVAGCGSAGQAVGEESSFTLLHAPDRQPPLVPPAVRWRRGLASPEFLPPFRPLELGKPLGIPGEGAVIAGATSGQLVKLDGGSGAQHWQVQLEGGIQSWLVRTTDALLVGTDDGSLHRLDLLTGERQWRYATKSVVRSEPRISEGLVFFTSEEETLYAVTLERGEWKWQHHRDRPAEFTISGIASPVLVANLIIGGFADGMVVAFTPSDGTIRWTRRLAPQGSQFADADVLKTVHGRLFVASVAGGLFELAPRTGEVLWQQPAAKGIICMVPDGLDLLVGTGDGSVAKVGMDGGSQRWRRNFQHGGIRDLLLINGTLYASSARLGLLMLKNTDGRVRGRFDPGKGIAGGIEYLDGQLFFLSNGGYLYSLTVT